MAIQKSGSPFLYDEATGDVVGIKDKDGGETILVTAQTDPLTGGIELSAGESRVLGSVPKQYVMQSAVAGANTGWMIALPSAERFAFELISGASAQLTVDGSTDGINSAAQIGTVSLDTVGQLISPPIWHRYPYVRVTHLSGAGVVSVARSV